MERRFSLPVLLLTTGLAFAQQPQLITLSSVDSTSVTALLDRPGAGYLIVTRQAGTSGSGSTLILTDEDGIPQDALNTPDPIVRAVLCPDSGYLFLVGSFTLLKTDAALNVEWASTMSAPPPTWFAMDIAVDGDAYYLAGNVRSQVIDTFQLNYNAYAAVLLEFDATGDMVDHVILADTAHTSFQNNLYQPMLAPYGDGSIYLGLSMLPDALSGTCNHSPTVVKLDANLDVSWAYSYMPSSYNDLRGVVRLLNGDLAIYGEYGTTVGSCNYFHHFYDVIDTAGTVLWAKDHHHMTTLSHATGRPVLLPDSTLLFPTVTSTPFPFVNTRYFHHVDAQGTTMASKAFTHPVSTYANANVLLTSRADGAIGVCRLNAKDTVLFATIDTTLAIDCYTQSDTVIDAPLTISRFAFQPHYLEHPFAFVDTLLTPFQSVPVTSLLGCDLSTQVEGFAEAGLSIFPNPSTGRVFINNSFPIEDVIITDALGRIVHRAAPNAAHAQLELPANGIYFVRIADHTHGIVRKVIVEGR